ncbi:MAG: AAA family ATPase [Candidatus Korarchaeota archaeon]|nr:AAA family ATPase [Candidatus Korarchaeota archaeon]
MRIKRLVLENFGPHEKTEVTFSDGINAIIGENGAGKTTILEAMAYALYPRSVSKQENLIRSGARKMKVQLEFELDGRRYLLIRERERGGISSASIYDVTDGRRLLQRDQSKVNRQIEALLGISRETFLQAIYVRQGEIAQLLEQTPSRRREVVGRLLGIEMLERIWEGLRDVISRLDADLQSIDSEIKGIGDVFKERASLESEREELLEDLQKTSKEEEILNKEMERLEKIREELERKNLKYRELKTREESLRRRLSEVSKQLNVKKKRLMDLERELLRIRDLEIKASKYEELEYVRGLLVEIAPLEEEIKRLERMRRELAKYEERVSSLSILREKVSKLSREIERLQREEVLLASMEERLRQLESKRSQLERRMLEYRREIKDTLSNLSELLGRWIKDPEEGERNLSKELSKLEGELDYLDKELSSIVEERSRLLQRKEQASRYLSDLEGDVDRCPLCGSKLDPGSVERLKDELKREIGEIDSLIMDKERELRSIRERRENILSKYKGLSSFNLEGTIARENELKSLEREISEISDQITSLREETVPLREKVSRLSALRAEIEILRRDLAEREALLIRIEEIRDELSERDVDKLREKLKRFKKDLEEKLTSLGLELESVDGEYREALSAVKEVQRLRGILSTKDGLASEVKELERRKLELEGELSSIHREIEGLSFDPSELEIIKREIDYLKSKLNSLTQKRSRIQGKIEEIDRRMEILKKKESKLRELMGKRESLEAFRLKILKVREVFSRDKGIQPLIRDRARPAVEEELNIIFSSFNFDYDSVTLDDDFTPSLKRGRTVFSFDRLSGGEKISLALALRLAITRFLMMSKVETFLLDEPTIHLDEERIDALVETMSSLNVPQLIVVTHSPRFRDIASHSILVSKSGEVSSVEVVDEGTHVSD